MSNATTSNISYTTIEPLHTQALNSRLLLFANGQKPLPTVKSRIKDVHNKNPVNDLGTSTLDPVSQQPSYPNTC